MTPRTEALAYQIWAFARSSGWDVTAWDIAKELGVQVGRVHYVLKQKGWNARTRSERGECIYASVGFAARNWSYQIGLRTSIAQGGRNNVNLRQLED
jgi:hypothetical protein